MVGDHMAVQERPLGTAYGFIFLAALADNGPSGLQMLIDKKPNSKAGFLSPSKFFMI